MLRNRRSRCLPSVGHLFQDHSRTIMTFCLQNCLQCYEMAFFIGYQVEGCFSSVKVQKSSICSLTSESFNRPVLHKRYFCNSQPGHNEDGVAEMPMVRCKPAAGWFPTPRVPRANMGDPYHIGADGIVTLSAMRELELLPVLFTLPPIRRWHTFWHYEGFF